VIQPFIVRPDVPSRFVQFSMPLPRGEHTWNPGVTPVRVFDGARELPCQVERIMRYPDGGAASLMVYADAGVGNAPASVEVRWEERREPMGEFEYHQAIREERDWFAPHMGGDLKMSGPVVMQRRTTMPHAESWITFFNDSPAVRIDAIFHNARPGSPEEVLGILRERPLPPGWEVTWVIVEPLGSPNAEIGDGASHFFPQRAQRIVRAVLAPKGYTNWTEAHPGYGWATVPSLWQSTSAWAPHFISTPDLSWLSGLKMKQGGAYHEIWQALKSGAQYPPAGNYPHATRHGFFHPQGSTEGGMTGGSGITYGPAGDIVQTGSQDALMHAFYQQRMWRDRDRTACIEPDGEPSTYEGRRVEIDSNKIRFSSDDYGRFDKSGSVTLDGSFNWSKQIPAPASAERTALLSFESVDCAHRIRTTYWDLALLQLANDPISRYLIRMDGELARMSWHSAHRDDGDRFAAQAGIGLNRDRILGWQLHAMAAAHCAGGNALRTRFYDDLLDAASTCFNASVHGPTLCALASGKQVSPAPYNNLYAVCVSIQEGLLTQGFVAAARAIGVHLQMAPILRAVEFLRTGTQTVWSAATWKLTERTPFTARQPGLDSTNPLYVGAKTDTEQTRSLLALAGFPMLESGEDIEPVMAAIRTMLGQTPRATMRKMGTSVLDSDSVLLAFLDRVGAP
jgi:hypothetical protein